MYNNIPGYNKAKSDYSKEEIDKIAENVMKFVINLKLSVRFKKQQLLQQQDISMAKNLPIEYEEYLIKNKQKVA